METKTGNNMRELLLSHINDPLQLEKLYRSNKSEFKKDFNVIYPEVSEHTTAKVWYERLNFEQEEISWGSKRELIFVIVMSLMAGLVAKIPDFSTIKDEFFFPRNITFIVIPFLSAYFAFKNNLNRKGVVTAILITMVSVVYINALPDNDKSDTLILACIHLPLVMWAVLALAFMGDQHQNIQSRLNFLRYNGDLAVFTPMLLIAGGLMVGISLGLFSLIEVNIEEFYTKYVIVWGLAAIPIFGTYIVISNPQLVNKVSPIIAKVFTPLVLVTLIVYLGAVIYTGKNPYNDREFLIIFNMLMIGVMAIILFSIAGTSKKSVGKIEAIMLTALSVLTIIINSIATSAIIFRLAEWGITPNRLAVLGGNILILINLILVTYRLFNMVKLNTGVDKVEKSIASFLPVYIIWAILVTFLFPLMFGFR